ncbi:MAG: hypothetical protein ACUVV3_01285 [Dehalococcoidia bacterium]
MKRYALSLAILALGLFWVSVGAPVWGGQSLLEPSEPPPAATPDDDDPAELAEKDAEVRDILSGDETIKALLAGRTEGRDYWIRISYVYEYMEAANTGEKPIAMVNIYFDPPLSYAGEVPVIASDPCKGRRGADERLDPDDPCMREPKEYSSDYRTFTDAQGIVARVELPRRQVVDVFQVPVHPTEMADIQRSYGQ